MPRNYQQHWIFFFITGSAAGIMLRSFVTLPVVFEVTMVGCALLLTVIYAVFRRPHIFVGAIFVSGVALGLLRIEISDIKSLDPKLESKIGAYLEVQGLVNSEPDVRERNTLLTIKVLEVDGEPARGKILVSADVYSAVNYGDVISLRGDLEKPENFKTDSGNVFNYVGYLGKEGIHYRMYYPDIEILERNQGNFILGLLLYLKYIFIERLTLILPEPEVSLLGGLLVGAKQSLGEELLTAFRVTGLVHIVVLSGYNLTIVAEAISKATAFLPRVISLSGSAFAIILFAFMTGASATIVRASIMALLVLLARGGGRVYDITRALFVTGFLMLMHNPKILAFDPSFQLSFLATFSLIQCAPRLEKRLTFIPERYQIRSLVAATLSTQWIVTPLLLYQTGMISLLSLFTNLLVLPLVPITMFFGFLTGVTNFVHTFVAFPFAWITKLLLSYQLFVATFFASLPFAKISVHAFPGWAVLLTYALLAGVGITVYLRRGYIVKTETAREARAV